MNLIDKQLDIINTLTAADFIQAMGRIYEEHIDRQDVLSKTRHIEKICLWFKLNEKFQSFLEFRL